MARIKPVKIDLKFGFIVGVIIFLLAIMETFSKIKEFKEKIFPEGIKLDWGLFFTILAIVVLITWFIMNSLWRQEYIEHGVTKKDRENLIEELKLSNNARLTDVITGVPNSLSMERDIEKYFSKLSSKRHQFIFIDLKNFKSLNKNFGFLKTNDLLRTIAQTIYTSMRRNEDMYKYFSDEEPRTYSQEGFYRVYPGGDEFVFIIAGDQADALGFVNRLVRQFEDLSKKTVDILGTDVKLSFYCSITEMDPNDTYRDIFKRAQDSYNVAKQGNAPFTICWHPTNKEIELSKNDKKKGEYLRTRELFEVLTLQDKFLD